MVARKNRRHGKGLSLNAWYDENKTIRRIVSYNLLVDQRKSPTIERKKRSIDSLDLLENNCPTERIHLRRENCNT